MNKNCDLELIFTCVRNGVKELWGLGADSYRAKGFYEEALMSQRESCAGGIKFLREHHLPRCVELKLFLKLNRTHCCETTEVMVKS